MELQTQSQLGLEHLGSGSRADRLSFRLVVALLLRCLPLLRGVRRALAALIAGWTLAGAVSIALALTFIAIWWSCVLGDALPSAWQAAFLGLDPATLPAEAPLAPDLRREIAERLSLRGILLAPAFGAIALGLYYFQVWILQRINQTLRVQLVLRLQALSLRFHAGSRVGDAIYRTYQDSSTVTQLIQVLFLTPLGASARFLAGIIGVALFDPGLALLLVLLWPPTLGLGYWISRRLRVGFRASREQASALTSRIQESLAGIKAIKAYGLERFEQERFEADSKAAFAAAFNARGLLAYLGVGIYWIAATVSLGALGVATLDARSASPLFPWVLAQGSGGALERWLLSIGFTVWSLGQYNAFKYMFGHGTGSTESIYRTWGRAQDIAIGLDRVFELLDLEPEVQDAPDAVPLPPLRSSITFEDVGFRYQPERPVLEDVRLEAKAGRLCAIVGPTGAGKSTLMALLLRLFDPQRGRVAIDGVDIRRFQVQSLRAAISIALQENVLFGTTVRENIRYAVPDASDAQVREAARVACADGFIEALPDGYDTLLGERGAKLSTGQRQRISIARALIKDAPVLILDEPTASLDAETELGLLSNLAAWGRGRVIFLITHRLSAIRRADQIAVVEGGRVIETGSHEELLARPRGAYRRLVDAQESGLPVVAEAAGATP